MNKEMRGTMNVTIYFKDGLVKSLEVDQIRENIDDFELYSYDWKDELFCLNKYSKAEIARLMIRG